MPSAPNGERRHEASPVGHATGCNEGDLQFFAGAGQEDEVRHVVFTGVAAAFEAVDGNGIAADALGLERVANGRALVDDLDARLLEHRHPLRGIVARRLHDLDAALDDDLEQPRIVGGRESGKKGHVHAEGLVGHFPASRDFVGELLGRALREPRDDAEAAGVGDCRGKLGEANEMHAALDDRVFDAKEFGDSRLHRSVSSWLESGERSGSILLRSRPRNNGLDPRTAQNYKLPTTNYELSTPCSRRSACRWRT